MRRSALPLLLAAVACKQDYQVVAGPVSVNPEDVTECPFSPVSGTKFSRYDCNPVFTGSDEDWIQNDVGVGQIGFHAEEVLGHPFYQMWYSSPSKSGQDAIGYAVSGDGVNWDPHPANPVHVAPTQGWNKDGLGAVSVVWDGDQKQYVLAYQGVNYDTDGNGLGMLTSPDGVEWLAINQGQPIVPLSERIGGVRYCWPLTIAHTHDDGFLGYIGGTKAAAGNECEIFGYGGDTLSTLRANPTRILAAGPGRYDQMGAASAAVVKFDDTFYMFYIGFRGWQPIEGTNFVSPLDSTLNMATSPDGLSWEKSDQNPILAMSNVTGPSVLGNVAAQVVGRRIHLWLNDYYDVDDFSGLGVGYFYYEPDLVDDHP